MDNALDRQIGPLLDLGDRDDQGVAGSQRVDREEGHARVVTPHKGAGKIASDDAREDGGHHGIVGSTDSTERCS
jgi:hypothetical protein